MKVLMISGDKNALTPDTAVYRRMQLLRAQLERFEIVYWGRGSFLPAIPQGQFDVVTVQDPLWRGLFALRIARRLKARFNVQVHMDLSALPAWKRTLAQFVLKRADSVRAVSQQVKQQIERLGVRAPIAILPVYIDTERFAGVVREPHEGKIVLWIGRFENEKDPLLALNVFKEVHAALPEARLIMLGAGSLAPLLRASLSRFNLDREVEFPGWKDPLPYLANADVVLSTSPAESYGASIVEALAAGVPVVSLDVGVAREAGAIIANPEQLAHEVAQVLREGHTAQLRLELLSKEEYGKAFVRTLEV